MARQIVTRPGPAGPEPPCRIPHLSDLHLGTTRAAQTQTFLQTELMDKYQSLDTIVITGDLFDQPSRRQMQHYRNFAQQLQLLCGTKSIIVPGNHDHRFSGTAS